MTVEFDAERHQYRVDGKRVPSVTQIVKPLGDDMDEVDGYMERALDVAAERGVTLHAYLAWRLDGGDADAFEIPTEYEPFAASVEDFISDHEIIPLAVETPMPATDFAGTPDLVCEFDGETAILDYKFVSQLAKSKVAAQLYGYKVLCEANGIFPEKLYAVQFRADGEYRVYPVGLASSAAYWKCCKDLWDFKSARHPRGRIGDRE